MLYQKRTHLKKHVEPKILLAMKAMGDKTSLNKTKSLHEIHNYRIFQEYVTLNTSLAISKK
jgi:hypothetical protein